MTTSPQEELVDATWQRYFERLTRYADSRLSRKLKRVIDGEDIAATALESLYRGQCKGRLQLADDGHLWSLLVTIANRKISGAVRVDRTQKRGGGQVRGESAFGGDVSDEHRCVGIADVPDAHGMPDNEGAVFDQCDEILCELRDGKLIATALLRMQGHSNREIADQLDCSETRIKQRLAMIRSRLAHLGSKESS